MSLVSEVIYRIAKKVLFSSVAQLCPTLCDPMDCSMPGFPIHHQLPELTQAHVHWVSDAIHLSHPLLSPSPPAFNLSQDQGLFKWVSSSHHVSKVLEFQLQPQSFQWIFRTDFLQDGLVQSPCSPRDSQESSPTPQFKSINSSALSFLYSPTLTLIHDYWKTIALTRQTFVGNSCWAIYEMAKCGWVERAQSWKQETWALFLPSHKPAEWVYELCLTPALQFFIFKMKVITLVLLALQNCWQAQKR